jgi:succinate dehydrogenase / fumarate reductase iron-sulfur subunit
LKAFKLICEALFEITNVMVALTLPKNSKVRRGRHFDAPAGAGKTKAFRIYRYDPETGENPRWDTFDVPVDQCGPMVLDALLWIKNTVDPSLAFRRSCREGSAARAR